MVVYLENKSKVAVATPDAISVILDGEIRRDCTIFSGQEMFSRHKCNKLEHIYAQNEHATNVAQTSIFVKHFSQAINFS